MTDWIEPKTLTTHTDKYRTMVDSIVRNDLLYLYQSTGTLSYSDWLGRR